MKIANIKSSILSLIQKDQLYVLSWSFLFMVIHDFKQFNVFFLKKTHVLKNTKILSGF